MSERIRKRDLVRTAATVAIVAGVWVEAGPWTGVAVGLLTISTELHAWQHRLQQVSAEEVGGE